ncbi:MAG: hypothetical protein B6I38_04965 [Anaerolineaceae bacterium 4572_5.1]|nr:MAG: hypothetical protein B6I38_04965 [Anaerolineaceae bacterium 4572_5.1]
MKRILLINLILISLILVSAQTVSAQEEAPVKPVYIVQPGDSLWGIAHRLHIDYTALLVENGLTSESVVSPGVQLTLPGLEGIPGVVTTTTVPYGESLESLSHLYQIPKETLVKLNRITSPIELYAGVSLVIVGDGKSGRGRTSPAEGESLLEIAVKENLNPWDLTSTNYLSGTWDILPGRVLHPPGEASVGPGNLPREITSIEHLPEQVVQGKTSVIKVSAPPETQMSGYLNGHPLHFFSTVEGQYVALQGVHAMAETGLIPLTIQGILPNGTPFTHRQMITIVDGNYPYRTIAGVPTETVDAELSVSEHAQLASQTAFATPEKRWQEPLQLPLPSPYINPGPLFGERRSFNGSGYYYFHSGLDFSTWGQVGIDILAPAAGEVVYMGTLIIYGNVTVLDHGWGVYTLYAHQSETLVEVGQQVEMGQVIGKVGTTGRSTGPHLHWEVWVGGVQVDPQQWLYKTYP